jgi:hypothetical protein
VRLSNHASRLTVRVNTDVHIFADGADIAYTAELLNWGSYLDILWDSGLAYIDFCQRLGA